MKSSTGKFGASAGPKFSERRRRGISLLGLWQDADSKKDSLS
jgi:hypothetical protein